MLVGYFDESGTERNHEIALYAGMVADSVMWSRIEQRWGAKLDQYGLSHYHAVDCENGEGEFSGMSRGIRDSLTNYFSALISEIPGQMIGQVVNHDDWERLVPNHMKAHFGDNPLYLSAVVSMQMTSIWSRACVDGEPVALVFATHQKHDQVLADIHANLWRHPDWRGLGSISFVKPQRSIPLQAADLICYEIRRHLLNPDPTQDRQARINFEKGGQIADAIGHYRPKTLELLMRHLDGDT